MDRWAATASQVVEALHQVVEALHQVVEALHQVVEALHQVHCVASLVPRPSHPIVCHLQLVLQATNAGVRRPGNEATQCVARFYPHHATGIVLRSGDDGLPNNY